MEALPYTTKVLRKLRRNLRLMLADTLLRWAEKAVPNDMHMVKLAILNAQLAGLDAMDFNRTLPPDHSAPETVLTPGNPIK